MDHDLKPGSHLTDVLAKLTPAERAELIKDHAHVTRFSDSSLYDEKCRLCGMVDGSLHWPVKQTIYNTDCPIGMQLRALLEQEGAQT